MKVMEPYKDFVLNKYYNCWLIKELLTEDEWQLALPFLQGLAKLRIKRPRIVMNDPVVKSINLDGCEFNIAELVVKYRTPYWDELYPGANQVDASHIFDDSFRGYVMGCSKCCVIITQSWYKIDGNETFETEESESFAYFAQFAGKKRLIDTKGKVLFSMDQAGQLHWKIIEREHFLRDESDYMTFANQLGQQLTQFKINYDMKVS